MIIALQTTATLVTHAQAPVINDISLNERAIVATASTMVSGLTSNYYDRFLCPAHYYTIALGSYNYQFIHFGSKIYEYLDRELIADNKLHHSVSACQKDQKLSELLQSSLQGTPSVPQY